MMASARIQSRFGVSVALAILLALGPGFALPAVAQEEPGLIRGFLLQDDEVTRISGAKVTAINVRTGEKYVSNITGENGAYEITGLPPATYDIGIEVAGAVYVTDSLVEVAAGQKVTLSFGLQPKKPNRKVIGFDQTPEGTAEALTYKGAGTLVAPSATKSFLTSPGGITLLSILGAGLLYVIFDDDDDDVSPSTP